MWSGPASDGRDLDDPVKVSDDRGVESNVHDLLLDETVEESDETLEAFDHLPRHTLVQERSEEGSA